MTDDLYYRKLESTSTTDLVDMIREKDERIEDLEKDTDQLTKAKELLKRFIETSNPIYFEEDRQKVKAEAEQFLKENE